MTDLVEVPQGWIVASSRVEWASPTAEASYKLLEGLRDQAAAKARQTIDARTGKVTRADVAYRATKLHEAVELATREIVRVMAMLYEQNTRVIVTYRSPTAEGSTP